MATITPKQTLEEIQAPLSWPDANRRLLGLSGGSWVDPKKRLSIFDPDEFEIFIQEWAWEYLRDKYFQVQNRGGSGDKGRDIVAWIDPPELSPRKWDNYQCKHYKDPLMPSDFWLEFGKLCYYTFRGDFTLPEKYFIVTPNGVGTSLQDYIDAPIELRKALIGNWEKYCEKNITKIASIKLEGKFKEYVENFDFSIVRSLLPIELIEQHSKTKYHLYVFGTQLKAPPPPTAPPQNIAPLETIYIRNIFAAFADHLKIEIRNREEFSHRPELVKAFEHARESFYSAETLKEFARDNLPDDSYFEDILSQFLDGLQTVLYEPHDDGFRKMLDAHKLAISMQINANVLRDVLRARDRVGMCHQLSNQDKIKWVNP